MIYTNEIEKSFDQININSSVSIVNIRGIRYILKKKLKSKDYYFGFEKLMSLFNFQFNTELKFNIFLQKNEVFFLYPKLIETDNKTYFLFEYIDGKNGISEKSDKKKLVHNYFDFQSLNYTPNMFLSKIYNVNLSYLRAVFSSIKYPTLVFKLILIFFKLNFSQKKLSRVVIHKDLKNYQNTISVDDKTYFIDFANVTIEKKWIMLDIVDMAFNLNESFIDFEMINYYFLLTQPHIKGIIKVESQIRFILIRKFLFLIKYLKKSNSKYDSEAKFLNNVLLDDQEYNIWLSNSQTKKSKSINGVTK